MGMRRRSLMNVVEKSTPTRITIENVKGSWGESSKTVSGYKVYESKGSYNVSNGYDLAKVTFSGYPNFTFLYGSYAESTYDYMKISHLDLSAAQNWTGSSSSMYLLSTSGKQSSSAPNLSHTFTNDGGEHFFYILYRKDYSANSGSDRGYIAFRLSNYLSVDNPQITISHSAQTIIYNIESDVTWSVSTPDDWILLNSFQGNGNGQLSVLCSLNEGSERVGSITFSTEKNTVTNQLIQSAYTINAPDNLNIKYGTPYVVPIEAELGLNVEYNCDWLACEIVLGVTGQNLKLTALNDTEQILNCEITIISGSATKVINVKLLSSVAYIEDGLVFELDGLDKCSTDQYCWVDKIGGKTFTNAGGVEELNNGFRFKRTSTSYLSCNTTLTSATYDQCTIEIVLKSDLASGDWAPVVMFGNWNITPSSSYIGVAALYSSHVNYAHSLEFVSRSRDGSTKSYKLPTGTLMSTSIKSNLPIIANGDYYNETSSTSRSCISNRPNACVGGRVDGSNIVTFKGDIHAIRVYNRLLTEDEILHNQNIDIQKYNIPI